MISLSLSDAFAVSVTMASLVPVSCGVVSIAKNGPPAGAPMPSVGGPAPDSRGSERPPNASYTRPMPVLGLHHAQVFYPAGEEARARRFYVEQLGLREIPRPVSLRGQPGLWFELPGGAHVHLAVEEDLALHPRRHFALRVDRVAPMRRA